MKILILLLFTSSLFCSNIKVLFTAALIDDPDSSRRLAYIKNLMVLKSYGLDVYVVESCEKENSYLDEFCDHVCYTHSNNIYSSKSHNEALSMLIGYHYFKFEPDDIIIKITGRYVLETDEFIRLVKANLDADIIGRFWNDHDLYTGLFAMRGHYFFDFLNQFNLESATDDYFCIEWGVANYTDLRKDKMKIVKWQKICDYLPRCGPAEG